MTKRPKAKNHNGSPPMKRFTSGLGWVRDLPDPRDEIFSAPASVLKTLPAKVDLKPTFPIYNQGRIGSCTANALAGAIQFDRLKDKQAPAFIPSRLFIYYNEREIEGHIANDAGAQLRDGIKTLQKLGVCADADWPYDDTPAPYEGGPFPPHSKPCTKPPSTSYAHALNYVITSYQRITPTLSQLQSCLAAGYPFVFGFAVFEKWYTASPRPATIPLPPANDHSIGGHAVLCVGYDNKTQLFKIRNSWGSDQGDHGYFYMPYAYLTSGNLAADFWVINAVKN